MNDLHIIPSDKNLKLVSFDIRNMYSNIPTKELIEIYYLMCNQNSINEELKHKIRKLSEVLIQQNYFQYKDMQYIQEGLAMAVLTSSVFSQIYLQHLEKTKIIDILLKYIIGYFRYVDGALSH
jgi:hypothetical protein